MFNFRLEPVLKQRVKKEEETILARYAAQKEHNDQVDKLDAVCGDLDRLADSGVEKGVTADGLWAKLLYMDYLTDFREKQLCVVEKTSCALESARSALINARKEKLVLEKYKEKKHEKYLADMRRWEEKQNDDLSTAIFNRKEGLD